MGFKSLAALSGAVLLRLASAQTFQRLGTCPTLGCIFPPDQADFLAGQYFDIRLEVHAPVNGSEAESSPAVDAKPDEAFTFSITGPDGRSAPVTDYFQIQDAPIERWNFTWYEDLFAQDARTPSVVNVAAKAYRRVYLATPGIYTATLTYYGNETTVATWEVRDLETERKAKNVLFFIGDGMTTNMITAARLIAHKAINGKYRTRMAMDKFPVLGHQMTHSIDTFITDSANSASALYTGHKSTVNCLGVYRDSSSNVFDDPKVETIAELFHRHVGGAIGIVSTAYIADATPAGLTSHTRDRAQSAAIIDGYLHGITNYTWTNWTGPDVLFGGGAENFYNSSLGGRTYQDKDYYKEFQNAGYSLAQDADQLEALPSDQKALGIFSVSNMAKWLDRNVYPENLQNQNNSADGLKNDADNQPGLKEMTLKAIDILQARSDDKGWFMMSEAASIDKMMHVLDYERALGELLELDDTISASIKHLEEIGELDNTLIVVTADHGHGFDVMGSVDTKYFKEQEDPRQKRKAIGVYEQSGQSQYVLTGNLSYNSGVHFPANWDPRYTLFQGLKANPDHREDYQVNKNGPRTPATNISRAVPVDYYANPKDNVGGIVYNGTLPTSDAQGVHSLTDVPVFARGPCASSFGGVYNSPDIFFAMAECLGLSGKTSGGYGA